MTKMKIFGKEEHKKAFGSPANGKFYILALSSFW